MIVSGKTRDCHTVQGSSPLDNIVSYPFPHTFHLSPLLPFLKEERKKTLFLSNIYFKLWCLSQIISRYF